MEKEKLSYGQLVSSELGFQLGSNDKFDQLFSLFDANSR